MPATFYLRLLATKTPLVVLAALVPGAIELWRRRRERGFHLVRLLAILLIVPYSLMAAKFLRYALPMIAIVDVIAAVGLVAGIQWLRRKQWLSPVTRVSVAVFALVVFGAGLVSAQQFAAPLYSTFQNDIGARLDPHQAAFPEETYDYGVREAVAEIAAAAPTGSSVVTDADAVAAAYLHGIRPDITVHSLSADGVHASPRDTFVIVQDEHASFENLLTVQQLTATHAAWTTVPMGDRVAARVFRIEGRR